MNPPALFYGILICAVHLHCAKGVVSFLCQEVTDRH